MGTETASHFLCECMVLVESRFHCLCKYFMESSNYDVIPLCKILYFIISTELLVE
jgi:hypothetical protein